MVECDLRDASSVRDVLEETRPSDLPSRGAELRSDVLDGPDESLITNIIGQLNIFEAVKKLHILPRIQLACSSEEYAWSTRTSFPSGKPIRSGPSRPTR